ncbi:hypothetical protein V8F20_001803 [Naviculisporaceae sp. PSN 640]
MAPKRAARGGAATPSPAPRPSPGPNNTPSRLLSSRLNDPGKAAGVRTPMPTKYSTSYGSPMSQLPNRAVIHGGSSLQQAASEVLKTVKEDHRAAVEARRQAEERRRTASERTTLLTAPTSTRASTRHESVEVEETVSEEPEQADKTSAEGQGEEEPPSPKRRVGRPNKTDTAKPKPAKRGSKRVRDEAEVDQQAEEERAEREERLRRERSEEAHRTAEEHRARAQAAAEQQMVEEARLAQEEAARKRAEQERRAEEEAARQKAEQERRVEEEAARQRAEQERRARAAQEEAAKREAEARRRALEEEAARQRAEQERRQSLSMTEEPAAAAPPLRYLTIVREGSMPPPAAPKAKSAGRGSSLPPVSTPLSNTVPRVPESVRSFIEESNVFGNAQLKTPKAKGSKAPKSTEKVISVMSASVSCPASSEKQKAPYKVPIPAVQNYDPDASSSSDPLTSDDNPPPPRPTNPKTTGGKTASAKNTGSSSAPRPPAPVQQAPRPRPAQEKPGTKATNVGARVAETLKSSFDSWSLWKIFLTSLLILYFYRLIYSLARPDLFDRPALNIRWYGWGNWKANAGQFFPSPLLHPLGVLTENQYSDLKDFLHDESSSTSEAVKSIESLLPRMVSVQKDRRRNKLIIGDDFWRALRDQIHKDDSILTLLEGKSEISEKHWRAIQDRLAKSGEIESIADKRITSSWEKWLNTNQKKVAEILGKNLRKGTAENLIHDIQDIVISREEFAKRLEPILEQNKLNASKLKELEKLVNKSRSGGYTGGAEAGISEAKVREIVSKAIKSAKLEAAAKSEISRFDAELQRRVNHFGIGNGAIVDEDKSSPTWEIVKPAFGTKEWMKALPALPRFLTERSAALAAWDEAGHCWCAGTQINATHSRPADLFVHLGNFVIPQHVVLEHIDPEATVDPEAMPKDVEIWAHYDEYHRTSKMADFMEVHFPESRKKNPDLLAHGFYQIGRFRYEHHARDKGVKVERLSKELVGLKAATDYVLVRAATNYGAKDHTCFYRVRLYGEVAEVTDGEKQSRGWS